ncbi:MAG: ABC transporter permease subunit [Elusimicrobia bacterium]|nr:ABC transporter permease subunit [Elusimicrobiota bacterium]
MVNELRKINFNNILVIFKREINAFFDSPVAYIVIVSFLAVSGWFFSSSIFLINFATLEGYLDILPLIFIFFVPAITMRLFSEEYKSGTIEILSTMPIADYEIILGKYLAGFGIISISILLTLFYPITLFFISKPHVGTIFGSYLGLLFIAMFYSSIGIFASSITKNQIVAFLVSFIICFFFFMAGKTVNILPNSALTSVFEYIGIDSHFNNITKGLIDSRDIIYYFSVSAFFYLLTLRMINIRK